MEEDVGPHANDFEGLLEHIRTFENSAQESINEMKNIMLQHLLLQRFNDLCII